MCIIHCTHYIHGFSLLYSFGGRKSGPGPLSESEGRNGQCWLSLRVDVALMYCRVLYS